MAAKWRLIIDEAGHPLWNMAVDEALFYGQTANNAIPVLRLYTWDRATLSIGHFQKSNTIPVDKMKELNIYPVGRITGGAAVLHGCDLTYCVAARTDGQMPRGIAASCQHICAGIIEGLNMLGVEAQFGQEHSSRNRPASCFVVFAPTDIVYRGRKLVGSAQHRKGEALLQHGSIMLKDNAYLLEQLFGNPGRESITLEQILKQPISEAEFIKTLIQGFSKALEIDLEITELEDNEKEMAEKLVKAIASRWPQ